jgi:anthranilate synthase component 1
MELRPSFEEFQRHAETATAIPVWCDFLFDVDTAVTAYAKLHRPPFGFLLESVVGGEQWARWSFVGNRISEAWRLDDDRVSLWSEAEGWREIETEDPLADLDARLSAWTPAEIPGLPRFWGGAVGFFGYDLVRRVEHLPDAPPNDLGTPDGVFVFTDVVLAIDNLKGRAMAIAVARVPEGADEATLRGAWEEAIRRSEALVAELREAPSPAALELLPDPERDPPFTSSMTREEFEVGVERIREYIRAGDAFQVVLSQRLSAELKGRPFDLYRALRSINPSPYLYFLELDGVTLVGSSPEVLVRLEDEVVTVRPIAGTRPRGATPEEDRALAENLLADEKELAEHRMLVDLGRNDVGRVARYGSVTVPERMVIERYSHVMHVVSQVEGRLAEDRTALDVLAACFPAGTVSGAPKIRAMQIIDELEPTGRGPYAGAVAHFSWGGRRMDTAITIRTVLVQDGVAHVQAGAGIVADSVPAAEYEETLNKARALLRAIAVVPPAAASGEG